MKTNVLLVAVMLAACSDGGQGGDTSADASVTGGADAPTDRADAGTPPGLERFYDDAANSICGALYRCCDRPDLELYFGPHRNSELLTAFHDQLPPNAELDEPGCRRVVADMLAVTPFGDWVAAARRGDVGFDRMAMNRCIAALDAASCGDESRAALFDGTCFGFSPPSGNGLQRAIFKRDRRAGASCSPIRDGVGAAFYGTCDASDSYCCYTDPTNPGLGCTYPFTGDGEARSGVCTAVSASGDSCSAAPPLRLCATGVNCDPNSDRCVAESSAPLAIGAVCADSGFNLLGECQSSYCDLLGSNRCEPLLADGETCSGTYQCQSGGCTGQRCGTNPVCDGVGSGNVDAGVGGMPDAGAPDAGTADAASSAAGETCMTAGNLALASSASTVPGYDSSLTGTFGASNDYNPYQSASPPLPPSCSFVYDAAGAEVVYALELTPGQRLDLRYAVAQTSISPAVYLLDSCGATPTWPDYDESGLCGSNEYKAQGFCGALGCDPVVWSFTYPQEVGGTPTAKRTFYLVLDHLGDTAPTGFELDWRIVTP